jgi:hypothetical protein
MTDQRAISSRVRPQPTHRPDTVSISQTSMQGVSKREFGVAVNPNYVSDAKRGGNRAKKRCGR